MNDQLSSPGSAVVFEPGGLAVDLELDIARTALLRDLAEHVGNRDRSGRVVRHELRLDSMGRVDRIPPAAGELTPGLALRVAQADPQAVLTPDQVECDATDLEQIGRTGGVIGEGATGDRLVPQEHRRIGKDLELNLPLGEQQEAGLGKPDPRWAQHVAPGIVAERVLPLLEPEQPRHREPPGVGAEAGLPVGAPGLDLTPIVAV